MVDCTPDLETAALCHLMTKYPSILFYTRFFLNKLEKPLHKLVLSVASAGLCSF